MQIDRGANMVMPKYIDEILNVVQCGNDKKSSCRMEEVETIFKCFWHLMSESIWMIWSIMYSMIYTYLDMSYALNVMSIYQSDKCHKMITRQ
jgi:hypothetical protein